MYKLSNFDFVSKSFVSISRSLQFKFDYNSMSFRFHSNLSSSSPRLHFELTSLPRWFFVGFSQFHSGFISSPSRFHFDPTSVALRFHFDLTLGSFRLYFDLTREQAARLANMQEGNANSMFSKTKIKKEPRMCCRTPRSNQTRTRRYQHKNQTKRFPSWTLPPISI